MPDFFAPYQLRIKGKVTDDKGTVLPQAKVWCISSLFYDDTHWVVPKKPQLTSTNGEFTCQTPVDRRTHYVVTFATYTSSDGQQTLWCHNFVPVPNDKIWQGIDVTTKSIVSNQTNDPIIVDNAKPIFDSHLAGKIDDDVPASQQVVIKRIFDAGLNTTPATTTAPISDGAFSAGHLGLGFYSLTTNVTQKQIKTTYEKGLYYDNRNAFKEENHTQLVKSELVFVDGTTTNDETPTDLAKKSIIIGMRNYVQR